MVLFHSIIKSKGENQGIPLVLHRAQATESIHCQTLIYDESNIIILPLDSDFCSRGMSVNTTQQM